MKPARDSSLSTLGLEKGDLRTSLGLDRRVVATSAVGRIRGGSSLDSDACRSCLWECLVTVTEKNGKSHFSVKVNSNYQSVFANTLNILLARSTLLHEYYTRYERQNVCLKCAVPNY